jgi:hypothetical protein
MKSPLLTHSVWSLAALGTFAVGYFLARPSSSSTARDNNRSLTVQTSLPGSPGNPLPSPGKTGPEAAALAAAARLAALATPEAIDALTKEALNDPNPLTRNLAFSKLLASMTPENVGMLLESLKTNRANGDQMRLFLYAWGAMDSAGALAHADTLEGRDKARFLNETIPGWASKDPQGAIGWLAQQPEGEETNRLRANLVGGLADHDIGLATSYVLERARANDPQAAAFMQTVAGEEIRKNGPAAATAWGESLPEGPLKGGALDQIAGAWVQQNPEAAAAWATKFAQTDYGARVVEEVGDEWAERDPKAAVAWLGSLTEGPARAEGTYSALREWTRRDPTAASQYLASMPQSASKDSAVSGFARSLAYEDPESAIIWARTITDEKSRVQTLTRAGQAWFRRDPNAATTWLQSAQLPADAQKAILNPPRDDRRRG